jgi:FAD-dependent urate hydroxylase
MKILIVGGGIGGMAAAIALHNVGIQSLILEQAPAITEVGAGLSLWPNALTALRRLGLEDRVVEAGSAIRCLKTITSDGAGLSEMNVSNLGVEDGSCSICIRRAELQKAMLERLPPNTLVTGARCGGFTQSEQGVTVQLADGKRLTGEFLVGADGINSVVRKAVAKESGPDYAGYTCWRGIADTPDPGFPPGDSLLALGPGSQIGMLHCGDNKVYWFATKNAPPGETSSAQRRKDDVAQLSKNWTSPIPEIIQRTPADGILQTDIYDQPPLRSWGRGPVTLLGDAAHATTPNLGQGACQALEDAVTLAACLQAVQSPAALRQYERVRYQRTARIVRASRWAGWFFQLQAPLLVRGRNIFLRSKFAENQTLNFFRELVRFEVPQT